MIIDIEEIAMKEFLKKYPYTKNCPFRMVMEHFGNKWSMIIIFTLGENGRMQFNELDKCIEDISQKVLTSTLRILEKDGFVKRKMYSETPPRVEYELSALGLNLLPLIESFADWSLMNISMRLKKHKQKKVTSFLYLNTKKLCRNKTARSSRNRFFLKSSFTRKVYLRKKPCLIYSPAY